MSEASVPVKCFWGDNNELPSSITVGDKWLLSCDGNFTSALEAHAQFIIQNPNDAYQLFALQPKTSTPGHFEWIVTSYRAGEHKDITLSLTDGKTTVTTSPLNFKVESVIQGQPQMIPSMGPVEIGYPLWFWLSCGLAILLVLVGTGFVFYRRKLRKKLIEELKQYDTMLSPFNQYSKDARAHLRALSQVRSPEQTKPIMEKIDECFRLYLTRELRIPALRLSPRSLLSEIKKSHRALFKSHLSGLRKVLFELEQLKTNHESVQARDCEELLLLTRRMVESINSQIQQQRRRIQ